MLKPVLQALVLADNVYQDRMTGKCVIAGTFTTITLRRRNPDAPTERVDGAQAITAHSRIGSPTLYLALVGVRGETQIQFRYVELSDAATVLFEGHATVNALDHVSIAEYIFPLPVLPHGKPGSYSLDVLYEGELLGQWRVTVVEIQEPIE